MTIHAFDSLKPLIALTLIGGLNLACSAGASEPRSSGGGGREGSAAGSSTGTAGSGVMIDPNAAGGSPGQPEDCDSSLEVTYRDFRETHPDFEMPFRGDVVRRGLVAPTLGADFKPAFANSVGCPPLMTSAVACDTTWNVSVPVLTDADRFAQWFRTTEGVNLEVTGRIELVESPAGSGQYVFESTAFFPLGPSEGFGVTPAGHYMGKNFLFTTEAHVSFGYKAGQKFTFRGDDDMWIFVNGKLAMDLGGMHGPVEGVIDFDAQRAELGIAVGNVYRMDVFHAERHTDGSNFKFTTNIACFTTAVVR
jgi:fibro-slime domain-containing protein